MHFEERKIILKDGRECSLRPTTAAYAEEMIGYLKQIAAETPFTLRCPDEVTFTVEGERNILTGLFEDERSVMMLGLVDGRVAGNCSVSAIGNKRRIQHRCSMAIALRKEYWNLGIGKAMIDYLTELAQRIGYEQMELDVVDGNDRAKHLYEKCGFIQTGRHVDAMRYDDGSYRDELIMIKKL